MQLRREVLVPLRKVLELSEVYTSVYKWGSGHGSRGPSLRLCKVPSLLQVDWMTNFLFLQFDLFSCHLIQAAPCATMPLCHWIRHAATQAGTAGRCTLPSHPLHLSAACSSKSSIEFYNRPGRFSAAGQILPSPLVGGFSMCRPKHSGVK